MKRLFDIAWRGFGWRLGALAAVFVVGMIKVVFS